MLDIQCERCTTLVEFAYLVRVEHPTRTLLLLCPPCKKQYVGFFDMPREKSPATMDRGDSSLVGEGYSPPF